MSTSPHAKLSCASSVTSPRLHLPRVAHGERDPEGNHKSVYHDSLAHEHYHPMNIMISPAQALFGTMGVLAMAAGAFGTLLTLHSGPSSGNHLLHFLFVGGPILAIVGFLIPGPSKRKREIERLAALDRRPKDEPGYNTEKLKRGLPTGDEMTGIMRSLRHRRMDNLARVLYEVDETPYELFSKTAVRTEDLARILADQLKSLGYSWEESETTVAHGTAPQSSAQ